MSLRAKFIFYIGIALSSFLIEGCDSEIDKQRKILQKKFSEHDVQKIKTPEELNLLLSYESFPVMFLSKEQVAEASHPNILLHLNSYNSEQFPLEYLTEEQVRRIPIELLNEKLGQWYNFPVKYLSQTQVGSLDNSVLLMRWNNNVRVIKRLEFPFQHLSPEQVLYLSSYKRLFVKCIDYKRNFPVQHIKKEQLTKKIVDSLRTLPHKLLLSPEFPLEYLEQKQVNEIKDVAVLEQLIAKESFPVNYLNEEQVQNITNQELLNDIFKRQDFLVKYLKEEHIQKITNSDLLNTLLKREDFPVQYLSKAQVQLLSENSLIYKWASRTREPYDRFTDEQKIKILHSYTGATEIFKDPSLPIHLMKSSDISRAIGNLNKIDRNKLLLHPDFPIEHLDASHLGDDIPDELMQRPGLRFRSLSSGQLKGIKEENLEKIALNPTFDVNLLSKDQIQALFRSDIGKTAIKKITSSNFNDFLSDEQKGKLLEGMSDTEFVDFSRYHSVRINQVSDKHLMRLDSETIRSLVYRYKHYDKKDLGNFINNKLSIGPQIGILMLCMDDVNAKLPREIINIITCLASEFDYAISAKVLKSLTFIELEHLLNTNHRIPLALLTKRNRLEIESWTGKLPYNYKRLNNEKPAYHFRDAFIYNFSTYRKGMLILKNKIAKLSNDVVAAMISNAKGEENRIGFPIGFLTKDQVQALPNLQLHCAINRITKVFELAKTLPVQIRADGDFYNQVENESDLNPWALGIHQRLFLFSRGLLPFAYLSPEQVKTLTPEQLNQIQNLRQTLQLGLLINRDFSDIIEGCVEEMFKYFFDTSVLPE